MRRSPHSMTREGGCLPSWEASFPIGIRGVTSSSFRKSFVRSVSVGSVAQAIEVAAQSLFAVVLALILLSVDFGLMGKISR